MGSTRISRYFETTPVHMTASSGYFKDLIWSAGGVWCNWLFRVYLKVGYPVPQDPSRFISMFLEELPFWGYIKCAHLSDNDGSYGCGTCLEIPLFPCCAPVQCHRWQCAGNTPPKLVDRAGDHYGVSRRDFGIRWMANFPMSRSCLGSPPHPNIGYLSRNVTWRPLCHLKSFGEALSGNIRWS